MIKNNNMKIGVFGNESSHHLSNEEILWIENLGKEIAGNGSILFTGGGEGIMQIVRRSCIKNKGFTVSIKPEMDAGNNTSDDLGLPIYTGLGKIGRVSQLIQSIDIGISIGGGSGTLMEIIACYLMSKPVIIINAFHKENDPEINNILNRVEEIQFEDILINRGFMDSKDISKVEPVTICNSMVSPDQVIRIALRLFNGKKSNNSDYLNL